MANNKRVSSRLIKQERKKITKQIVWFSSMAIVLVLIFLFVVLPLFIKFVNGVLNTNPIAEEDTVILQPPVLSAPVSATNSARFKIDGFADPKEKVYVILNGQKHNESSTNDDGSFSVDVLLTEGENSLTTYAVDEKDRESKTGHEYTISLDTEEPELEVTEPEDGREYNAKDSPIIITGKTEPNAKVYISERVVFPDSMGDFRTNLSLANGENEIKIRAVDKAGNYTEIIRKVKYNN